jgi:signal transduction histidine kinase
VDDARDRKAGGVGLGLAIAQRAIQLHGGTVSAANAPDGGLIVTISLGGETRQ